MVGRRNVVGSEKNGDGNGHGRRPEFHHELNSGPRIRPRDRFKDIVHSVVADGRREQMKKKLIDGVNGDNVEKFRKSDDEVYK